MKINILKYETKLTSNNFLNPLLVFDLMKIVLYCSKEKMNFMRFKNDN